MEVLFIHLVLALILFFTINFLGKESHYNGYEQISVFSQADSAPVFNFIYRAFSPIVFIVLLSMIFYKLGLDYLVKNIFLIVFYQFLIRFLFNLIIGRRILIDWKIQFLLVVVSFSMSYFVYHNFILNKEFLFPSNENIGNAIWLGIIAYLYKTFNNMSFSSINSEKRQQKYILNKYSSYKNSYGKTIKNIAENVDQERLIYSVLLLEDFNRPKLYRFIENVLFLTGKVNTLGIMQVTTKKKINDLESVELGSKKIVKDWNEIKQMFDKENEGKDHKYSKYRFIGKVLEKYNPSSIYKNEGCDIYFDLKDNVIYHQDS